MPQRTVTDVFVDLWEMTVEREVGAARGCIRTQRPVKQSTPAGQWRYRHTRRRWRSGAVCLGTRCERVPRRPLGPVRARPPTRSCLMAAHRFAPHTVTALVWRGGSGLRVALGASAVVLASRPGLRQCERWLRTVLRLRAAPASIRPLLLMYEDDMEAEYTDTYPVTDGVDLSSHCDRERWPLGNCSEVVVASKFAARRAEGPQQVSMSTLTVSTGAETGMCAYCTKLWRELARHGVHLSASTHICPDTGRKQKAPRRVILGSQLANATA